MQAQRSRRVQGAWTRRAKIVRETRLGLVVEDTQSLVNGGQHGLLVSRHLSGRKYRILENFWFKVLQQFFFDG